MLRKGGSLFGKSGGPLSPLGLFGFGRRRRKGGAVAVKYYKGGSKSLSNYNVYKSPMYGVGRRRRVGRPRMRRGGAILPTLRHYATKAHHFVRHHKLASRGLNLLGHSKAAAVANALGYGRRRRRVRRMRGRNIFSSIGNFFRKVPVLSTAAGLLPIPGANLVGKVLHHTTGLGRRRRVRRNALRRRAMYGPIMGVGRRRRIRRTGLRPLIGIGRRRRVGRPRMRRGRGRLGVAPQKISRMYGYIPGVHSLGAGRRRRLRGGIIDGSRLYNNNNLPFAVNRNILRLNRLGPLSIGPAGAGRRRRRVHRRRRGRGDYGSTSAAGYIGAGRRRRHRRMQGGNMLTGKRGNIALQGLI